MSDGRKLILSSFTWRKNEKLGIRLEENICQKKEDKIQLKQAEDHITKQEGWLEAFLDNKVHFFKTEVCKNFANSTEKHLCWSFFLGQFFKPF